MHWMSKIKPWLARYARSFSFVGLAVAALLFAASVTPSLLPRHYLVQGLLSGFALAIGYGVGVAVVSLYYFVEFRDPSPPVRRYTQWTISLVVAVVFLGALRQMTYWQNSVRELMQMPTLESSYPFRTAAIALVWGLLLIALVRLLLAGCRVLKRLINRVLPRRAATALSLVLVGVFLLLVGRGVVARGLLSAADAFFLQLDELVDEGVAQPASPWASGSEPSLIEWDSIGRRGKNFIVGGPRQAEIAEFLDRDALDPIRVYVGMRSRETMRERAELALQELIRVGGFDRSVLIVATPTGTGWLDPGGVDTVEYLHGGDTAIVTMQYSYLPSWLTLIVDPRRSIESADELFEVIYSHWRTLPRDSRPKLYLHGLSLGALGGEVSADLVTIFEDPIHGALWSGAPFASSQWAGITSDRRPESPQWLPEFRDGRLVRFANQFTPADPVRAWGPMRIVYIQYASDPMIFFSTDLPYREPDWLSGRRGQDVSSHLRWYPLITFLQIGFDLPMATSVPAGYGHNYAPADYIDGWLSVTAPPNWSSKDTPRLKAAFTD